MTVNNALLWLLALPFIVSPVAYLAGRVSYRTRGTAAPARWVTLAGMVFAWYPLVVMGQSVTAGTPVEVLIGSVMLRMDGIGLLLSATTLFLGTLVVIFSIPYLAGEEGEEKYYSLLPATIGAIIGLGTTTDLFNLWVWFEIMAVSSYLLVAFYTQDRSALEAGVKYLVQSAVGSVFVMIGVAMVFAVTGTLNLAEIAAWQGSNALLLAAGSLFVIGFGVKTALVPLHTWLPDAHSQAPSGISAMLSGVVIEAGLVAMLRALGNMPGGLPVWGILLLVFGALNMLIGNLMALRQTQVKRMLAYSSLSHVGYMLLGFGAAAVFHVQSAAQGSFFHLFNHAVMKGLAFLAAGILLYALHVSRGEHSPLIVDDLNGASKRYPLAAFGLSVALLALGGLPPLAGFMSKWQIFAGSVETRSLPVILLVVFAALNSVLSLGYYAPLVNRMYRREPSSAVKAGKPVSWLMSAPVVVLVVFVVVLGFLPALVQEITSPAAGSLAVMFGGQLLLAAH